MEGVMVDMPNQSCLDVTKKILRWRLPDLPTLNLKKPKSNHNRLVASYE